MSGQPNKNPLDASKFREAYMSNLNLRIAIDDKNLQANKNYNRTGQLPVEPSDFRTIEEKLADVLSLRKEVRSQLGKITDGVNANNISQQLTPPELVFYYQQSPTINQIIKERYSKGVLADIFVGFLRKYMADTLANKGVASGLQQVSGSNLVLSGENIARNLATQPDYLGLLEMYMGTGINIARPITDAINILPPPDLFTRINAVPDENERFTLLEEANNYLKDLPTKSIISSKIREVQRLKNSRDITDLRAETDRIISLIKPTDDTRIQLQNIISALLRTPEIIPPTPTRPFEETDMYGYEELPDAPDEVEEDPTIDETPSRPKRPKPIIPIKALIKRIVGMNDIYSLTKPELLAILRELDNNYPSRIFGKTKLLGVSQSSFERASDSEERKLIRDLDVNSQLELMDLINALSGKIDDEPAMMFDPFSTSGNGLKNSLYMVGSGITQKKRYDKITKSDIDTTKGISKLARFIPLGRYVINRHRLNDNVVSLKRPSGAGIVEFPSQRVSNILGNVLRKIVGNGIPAFEDLEALDEDEKAYLHKLAKQSQIIDRLSIPAPKKSDIDKDLNRFEILKGQIMSGNDNKELIKEFKILLMKLSTKKLIPKPQVREMLFDLTSMGY
jgi:hypothetical protein